MARENDKARGIGFDPNAGKVLFRDAAAAWLLSRPDLKETTRAAYADALALTDETTAKRHKPLADLRIDAVFGSYPINAITRDQIRDWVARMQAAGKRPSTIRNAYFLVRMVLAQAVEDNKLPANPADYVKLPTDHNTSTGAAVDDPAQFLTPAQVAALVAATPEPYGVIVHLAAWSGLRAAELAGLQVADVSLPKPSLNPNAPAKPGALRVDRTVARISGELIYITPKTKGSRRTVPLTAATTALLREYIAQHPRRADATAPLFRYAPAGTPPHRCPRRRRRWGSDHDGWQRGATAGDRLGRAGPEGRRRAARARLDRAVEPRRVLQGCVPPGGVAGQQAYADRRDTGAAEVPRPPPHVRELVHCSGPAIAGDCAVYGPREGHHDARRLRPPVQH